MIVLLLLLSVSLSLSPSFFYVFVITVVIFIVLSSLTSSSVSTIIFGSESDILTPSFDPALTVKNRNWFEILYDVRNQYAVCFLMCTIEWSYKELSSHMFIGCLDKFQWVFYRKGSLSGIPAHIRMRLCQLVYSLCYMMTSTNGNIFRVVEPLYGEFTGHRWILTKASDAGPWYILWSVPKYTVE